MNEYMYELKVPLDRVAVLIGPKGETKRELEGRTKTKITVDSKEGDIFINGEDPILLFSAREVIKAVGRGFNPETAMLLLKQDYGFELILIDDFIKNRNQHMRIKGRVIGKDGSSRRTIEELTETYICVYGKTIGVIGQSDRLAIARKAVESLLTGSPHASVYKWLEKKRRDLKISELEGMRYGAENLR
jgi:ribosomal RNA assembly protein